MLKHKFKIRHYYKVYNVKKKKKKKICEAPACRQTLLSEPPGNSFISDTTPQR